MGPCIPSLKMGCLKSPEIIGIGDNKEKWDEAVIKAKMYEWPSYRAKKTESITIEYVGCNIKGHSKSTKRNSKDEHGGKLHFILVLRIEHEVGYSKGFSHLLK